MSRTLVVALLALPLLVAPAHSQTLNRDIVSPKPEAKEDCEALADRLRDQRDDGVLNPADRRELRDSGC